MPTNTALQQSSESRTGEEAHDVEEDLVVGHEAVVDTGRLRNIARTTRTLQTTIGIAHAKRELRPRLAIWRLSSDATRNHGDS
jgi:hypothetical protein